DEAFGEIVGIEPPRAPAWAEPNWQSYAIRITEGSRNRIAQELLNAGIACRPGYMACHVQPVYRSARNTTLPNTERALDTVIILPMYAQMTEAEQDYVISQVQRALHNGVRPFLRTNFY